MVALVSFRSFFVVCSNQRAANNMPLQTAARRYFKDSFLRKMNPRRRGQYSLDDTVATGTKSRNGLPSIPRGQMTGLRSFINKHAKASQDISGKDSSTRNTLSSKLSNMMESTKIEDEDDAIRLNPYPASSINTSQELEIEARAI